MGAGHSERRCYKGRGSLLLLSPPNLAPGGCRVFLEVDAAGGLAHGQGLSAASRAACMARDTGDGMWLHQGDSSSAKRGQQRGHSACTCAHSRTQPRTHAHTHACTHLHARALAHACRRARTRCKHTAGTKARGREAERIEKKRIDTHFKRKKSIERMKRAVNYLVRNAARRHC